MDQDTQSIYVRLLSNDVIGTDDENPYTFYQYPRHNWLVGVGTVGSGPINPTSSNGNTILSSTTDSTTDTTPATSYGYALDGRRIGKAGHVNMKYLYDGENVIYELWEDMTVRFTHPLKSGSCGSCGSCGNTGSIFFTDHPISITIYDENGIPTKYYYLYDGLGSVTEVIDANQNVMNIYRYTPFGDALIREETVYNPYQYTGRQYDAESGLYHYRARAYSADIGRFMQQDPAGMVDGANMYAYVGNNPVNGRDPSGMLPIWWKAYQRCSNLFNSCSALAYKDYSIDIGICAAAGVVIGEAAALIGSFFLTPAGGAIAGFAGGIIGSSVCGMKAKSNYKKALANCNTKYSTCMKSIGLSGLLLHPL